MRSWGVLLEVGEKLTGFMAKCICW
jgi:hypothetical protein